MFLQSPHVVRGLARQRDDLSTRCDVCGMFGDAMTTPIKWERKGNGFTETQAHVGKFRLRVWADYDGWCIPCGTAWQKWYWAVEGHQCRVLASGGAPTIGRAKSMAEACAKAATKAGLR
jgi:hypothetical protein